jgi:hypothetical protein
VKNVTPDEVLDTAIGRDFRSLIVVGFTKDDHYYVHASSPDIGELLILLELTRRELMSQIESGKETSH